ncbi:MAG: TerB family tellurite resistance protein [Proteobacteria bacterium]|nr:TerB family tellurite resistance protein [Pseudomonadota bacterium]
MDKENLKGVAALLVHVAKVDEAYTDKEKQIIKSFINSFNESDGDLILKEAEELESNSNQLLSFTRAVKDQELEVKKEIIEHLWKIIISDQNVDHYEANLMRRICGLIYFPDKLCGEIKLKVLKSN